MPLSAVDAINPAFEHAKRQLFQPFRFGQWVRLAFVGLLAGELGSSGGCNFGNGIHYPPSHSKGTTTDQWLGSGDWPPLPGHLGEHYGFLLAAIVAFVVVAFIVGFLFLYVGSVMRFILFDSIIARECHIRAGWARRKQEGWRLFVWQVLFMLVTFATLFVLVVIPLGLAFAFGWLKQPKEHVLELILGGFVLLMIFLCLMLVLAVVHVMTKDFVVPQMAMEGISASEGWRRLWGRVKIEKGGYAGYLGMKLVLAIAAGIAFAIVMLITVVILLIPVGAAGIAAVLGAKAAGFAWNFYTIALASVIGLILLAGFLFVSALLSTPLTVFFPAYSIYFFASRYPPLAALVWPQPPVAPVPRFDLPPLPPTPAPLG